MPKVRTRGVIPSSLLVLHVLLQHPFSRECSFQVLRILSGSHEQCLPAMHDRQCMDERLARRRLPHPIMTSQRRHWHTSSHDSPLPGWFWHEVLSWIWSNWTLPIAGDDFWDWWASTLRATPLILHKGTSSVIMLIVWWLWKHHNIVVFDNAQPSMACFLDMINAKAWVWAKVGAQGICQLLP
jgi:hypothetical protein